MMQPYQLLSLEEHSDKLQEEIDYLIKLRFAHAVTPIENPMKIRSSRRLIARLKTAQAGYKHKQPSEA